MASFLPSFFQKRLLRYALSRLELVDTEALDLDSLGIRWGQRSTVELRDVGLRLEKLAALLHLPPSSELLGARVRFLQITVPADIHSSGIICEANGVEVHLRLPSDDAYRFTKDGKPSSQGLHHPSDQELGGDHILPTPANLAQSFLETEPKEEKDELQAAISSRSQVLHRASVSSSDDEEELGLGEEGLSLPSFVAAFLKGVADRLQVKVSDVSIRADMEMRQDGSAKRQPEYALDLVTGLLSVREATVGAVSALSGPDDVPSGKEDKRLVYLSGINMALVSDPVVFSNYSRFASPTSPTTTMLSKESRFPSRAPSPPPESSPSPTPDLVQSAVSDRPDAASPSPEPHPAPEMEHSSYTHDGRFSDADMEAEKRDGRDLEGSERLSDDDGWLDNPACLDSVIDSQIDENIEGSGPLQCGEERAEQPIVDSGDTPRSVSPQLHASGITGRDRGTEGIGNLGDSGRQHGAPDTPSNETGSGAHIDEYTENSRSESPSPTSHEDTPYSAQPPSHESAPSEFGSDGSQSGPFNAELSESKVFSNEDAQSLYMSVASHASPSKSFIPNMPGAWDDSTPSRTAGHDNVQDHPTGSNVRGVDRGHGMQDETTVSTPKLTAQPGQSFSSDQDPDNSQVKSHEASDTRSRYSSPSLNKATSVAKTFLTIDEISVWLPSVDDQKTAGDEPTASHYQSANDSAPGLRDSSAEDDLLESKNYASTRFRRDSADSFSSVGNTQPDQPQHPQRKPHPDAGDESHKISVEVHSTEIQLDIATGWLLTKMCQKAAHAFIGNEGQSRKTQRSVEMPRRQAFGMSIDRVSAKFVEHIFGYAYPAGSLHSSPSFRTSVEDVILQATASGLSAHYCAGEITKFGLDVSRFVLGFASDDLLSFNETLKMRESTRDILSPVSGDISFSVSKSSDSARINLATLPLQINLNIQRLDEALGWLGGVSAIVELGNSFSSLPSAKGTKDSNKRPRGVHFKGTPPPDLKRNGSTPWKVNARVGGVLMDVAGENHYLRLTTTAVKAVSRFEGIGVQVDKAKLTGPFAIDDGQDPPAKISLANIRVEYLFSPKEVDLDRLLALITPSKDKYDEDDDIMLDTLFRQRRQGSVLRVTVAGMKTAVSRSDDLESLSHLGNELSKLSNVAKYLPEDDRPGILTLVLVKELESHIHVGGQIGDITAHLRNAEVAYITIPSLVAARVGTLSVVRNDNEELLGEALPLSQDDIPGQTPPILMARFIPDEMDPTIKIKSHNLRAEYTIQSMAAFLGLSDDMTSGRMASNMAKSLANFAEDQPPHGAVHASGQSYRKPGSAKESAKPTRLAMVMRDSIIGLNPRDTPAKGLVVLTSAKLSGVAHGSESSEVNLDLRKASVMVVDDVQNVDVSETPRHGRSAGSQNNQVQSLIDVGYVPVSSISSATATAKLMRLSEDGTKSVDVELRDNLLILESCADSTQTLIAIVNGLQPPTPPSVTAKYRTEVMPIQDMLASFSGDAYAAGPPHDPDSVPGPADQPESGDPIEDELEYVSDFYPGRAGSENDEPPDFAGSGSGDLLDSFHSQYQVSSSVSELDFRDDHFAKQSDVGGTAHRWDSAHNTYGLSNDEKLRRSPLRIRIRDVHVIWNLFDGYDWQQTRDTISKAVNDVETRAAERRARTGSRMAQDVEEEEEPVIGDCLFNSVYIEIPANKDPRELRADINRNIDDLVSETGSYATTSTVTATRQNQSPSVRGKKLRLSRSKHHKMTFELKGISADLVVFPPDSEETQSSLDIRVGDLEIFDHVPSSTWKKFASYMREAGEKESGTSMAHLEMLTVKPVPELAASEIVLKATVLPLRLHVDQDALDFMCRFFEFRDESAGRNPPGDVPFLQRVEVNAVPVKLDFKPKRVDYAGLRSGRTTEFMNFFVLDAADMLLRHVIIYGVSGFDKLGHTLNDIWMPDIKRNQLPSVLSGLAPIRSLVNVGGGMKDLVVVPMREYRKDGRIVRSMQKGALAFAKTTSNELVKLGAKLAIGTQTVLQGAEDLLNTPHAQLVSAEDDAMDEEEEAKKISLYADQPIGVVQGLRGAFGGLERDMLVARDAVVAVPGEVLESGSAKGAAKAVWKRTPTVVLRPAIGVSKAVGQTLLGAGNTLDPSNRRRMEDKYKHH